MTTLRRAEAAATRPSGRRTAAALSKFMRKKAGQISRLLMPRNGKLTDLTQGDQAVTSFRSTPDGSKLVYTVSTPTLIGDLYLLERPGA